MNCPFCGNEEDKVIESRTITEGNYIRRRRECLKCNKRFTTHETIEKNYPIIVKKDGRKEIFDKNKVINGMQIACRKRPVTAENIIDSSERILYNLMQTGKAEIQSDVVGNMVCNELKDIDMVAYIRFASVYRKFEDVEEFRKIIDDKNI